MLLLNLKKKFQNDRFKNKPFVFLEKWEKKLKRSNSIGEYGEARGKVG